MESITESGVEFTLDWKEWLKLEREHPAIRLGETLLAEPCARCKATGKAAAGHPYADGYERCIVCDGRGYNMTPAGKELQRFIAVFGSSLFGQSEPAYARTGINNSGLKDGTAYR